MNGILWSGGKMDSNGLNKVSVVNWIVLGVFLALLVYLTVCYAPALTRLVSEPEHFRELIQSYGEKGVLVFIAFQVIQVVISAIPGEVVQIAGGYLYGVGWGTLYLLVGLLIGSVFAFYTARLLGYPVFKAFLSREQYDKFRALLRSKRFDLVVFLLFLIPGLPKDLLTYAAGLAAVPPLKFFLLATGARLPALVGSVIIGANLQERDYLTAALLLSGAVLLFFLGYFAKDRILDRLSQWDAARERSSDGEKQGGRKVSPGKEYKKKRMRQANGESPPYFVNEREKGWIRMEKIIFIEGMSCQHCVAHVENALNQVAGVRKVQVDLGRKRAVVEVEAGVSDDQLKAAVEEMGYDVTAIKDKD